MRLFDAVTRWTDAHHPVWLDALRVLLGIVLFMKGLSFILDRELVAGILQTHNWEFIPVLLLHYVLIFQMAHSILIMVGLITRVAVLMQLPIILGALLVIGRSEFSFYGSDLWLLLVIIFLLVVFFIYGPGHFSVDEYLKRLKLAEEGKG